MSYIIGDFVMCKMGEFRALEICLVVSDPRTNDRPFNVIPMTPLLWQDGQQTPRIKTVDAKDIVCFLVCENRVKLESWLLECFAETHFYETYPFRVITSQDLYLRIRNYDKRYEYG